MNLSILGDKERFRKHVIEALAEIPLDYLEQIDFIEKHRKSPTSWEGAGVLLPLFFSEEKTGENRSDEYVFLLNKRSRRVQQAGDLCAPGGGIHPVVDTVSQKLLQTGLWPWANGAGFKRAKQRGKEIYPKILFYLGNALRESWEEMRLSPFNVEFLGALQTYRLKARRWIMFPLVGRVKEASRHRLSDEVEKIVSIPLQNFFRPENYAIYSLEVPERTAVQGIPRPWEFPCLVFEQDGGEEILWGATFNVIQSFLNIVIKEPLPSPDGRRIIHRPLASNYLSGDSGENL